MSRVPTLTLLIWTIILVLLPVLTPAAEPRPIVLFKTNKGNISVELFADKTPRTTANFLRYVEADFFDDTIFHRVVPKLMIQGGGFTPELKLKEPLQPIKIESRRDLPNIQGSVAMARTTDPNSASSQFFINLVDNDQFDRSGAHPGYTVFGRVLKGMQVVDSIASVQTSHRGPMRNVPIFLVIVISVRRIN